MALGWSPAGANSDSTLNSGMATDSRRTHRHARAWVMSQSTEIPPGAAQCKRPTWSVLLIWESAHRRRSGFLVGSNTCSRTWDERAAFGAGRSGGSGLRRATRWPAGGRIRRAAACDADSRSPTPSMPGRDPPAGLLSGRRVPLYGVLAAASILGWSGIGQGPGPHRARTGGHAQTREAFASGEVSHDAVRLLASAH